METDKVGGKRPGEGGREMDKTKKKRENGEREERVTPRSHHFTQLLCNTSPLQASILDEVHLKANGTVAVQAEKTLGTKQRGITSFHRNMR